MLSASKYFLQSGEAGWAEFDEYLNDHLDFMLDNAEIIFDIPKSKPKQLPSSWFFITLTTLKDEGYDIAYSLAETALNSKLFAIEKYVYCIEKGEGENWHIHMLALSSARNNKYNTIPVDKVRQLKPFKNRRFEIKKLKQRADYTRTLNYILKDAGKYPEVTTDLGGNIFANYELPFKDIKIIYINELQ